jgi:hypothetical protein
MQGAIQLIAAKRADHVSSEVAAHDYEVNCRAEMLIADNTELTRAIKELTEAIHHRVIDASPSVAADDVLETPTKPQDRVGIGDVRYPRGLAGVERATVGRQAFLSVAAGGGPDCVKRSAEQRGLALLCSSMRSYARAPTESGTITARAESFFSRGPGRAVGAAFWGSRPRHQTGVRRGPIHRRRPRAPHLRRQRVGGAPPQAPAIWDRDNRCRERASR